LQIWLIIGYWVNVAFQHLEKDKAPGEPKATEKIEDTKSLPSTRAATAYNAFRQSLSPPMMFIVVLQHVDGIQPTTHHFLDERCVSKPTCLYTSIVVNDQLGPIQINRPPGITECTIQ
jgi:hypothetical protein